MTSTVPGAPDWARRDAGNSPLLASWVPAPVPGAPSLASKGFGLAERNIVVEVCVTGGPCAGKTTGLTALRAELHAAGWSVLIIPEASTMLISSGVDIASVVADPAAMFEFQRHLVRVQRHLRAEYRALAAALGAPPTMLVADRGELDTAAYIGDAAYAKLCAAEGWDRDCLSDSYDAVFHLATAASGSEGAYTLANNEARIETPQQARTLDGATLAAWVGHPELVVVDNSTGFEEKLARLSAAVLASVGAGPDRAQRKFRLRRPPSPAGLAAAGAVAADLEQVYLIPGADGAEVKLRRRQVGGHVGYYRVTRLWVDGLRFRQSSERIGVDEWAHDLAGADPTRRSVRKRRWTLIHSGRLVDLDCFAAGRGLWLAEVGAEPTAAVTLPGWLDVAEEVTGQPAWLGANLAAAS